MLTGVPLPGALGAHDRGEFLERQRRCTSAHGVAQGTWVHHPDLIQAQVLRGHAHAARQARRILALELHADALAPVHEEQVQFGAAVNMVEIRRNSGQ